MDKMKYRKAVNGLDNEYCNCLNNETVEAQREYLKGCLIATNSIADKCLDDIDIKRDLETLIKWFDAMGDNITPLMKGKKDATCKCYAILIGGGFVD